ncbi:MAG TPA: hypothetical protein VNT42_03265 [Sphingomonas sp.]|nr:hypothetical protein [Sphingomonas sp.]
MSAPFLREQTVADAIVDLVSAADHLARQRELADRIVAALEARWAHRRAEGGPVPAHAATVHGVVCCDGPPRLRKDCPADRIQGPGRGGPADDFRLPMGMVTTDGGTQASTPPVVMARIAGDG